MIGTRSGRWPSTNGTSSHGLPYRPSGSTVLSVTANFLYTVTELLWPTRDELIRAERVRSKDKALQRIRIPVTSYYLRWAREFSFFFRGSSRGVPLLGVFT